MCDVGKTNSDDLTDGQTSKVEAAMKVMKNPSSVNIPLSLPDRQAAAFSKGPGRDMGGYIGKDVPVDAVKGEIRGTEDISRGWGLISGTEMMASIKNHPAIYTMASWINHARARGELYDRERLAPLNKAMKNMVSKNWKESATLMEVMKREMFAKERLTAEELVESGLNQRQIDVYIGFREEADMALIKVNENRRLNGQKEVTAHEAYIASRWGGDWQTPVYDEKGRIVWFVAERSEAAANHALAWIKVKHPDLDFSKSKVKHRKGMDRDSFSFVDSYAKMKEILGEDSPLLQQLEDTYSLRLQKEGSQSVLGMEKHYEPKTGVRGFTGDRPWANQKADVEAFWEGQMSQLRNEVMESELRIATTKINEIVRDPEFKDSHPVLLDLMKDVWNAEMGRGSHKAVVAFEKALSKKLGQMPDYFPLPSDMTGAQRWLNFSKEWFYVTKLGVYNVPFAIVNAVQPVFTIPHHLELANQGYKFNPLIAMFQSMRATGAALSRTASDTGFTKMMGIEQVFVDAAKYMEANGITALNQFSEIGQMNHSAAYTKAKSWLGWSITGPEKFARTMAFMSYVSHLEQSGKFKGDQMAMFEKAHELTNKSMVNYKHTARADVFNKLGVTGNALATLQSFKVNQYNQLYDFGKKAYKGAAKGDLAALTPLITLMATQLTMAGAMGFYGMQAVEDMWDYYKDAYVKLGGTNPDILTFSPKQTMLENLPEWMAMGGLSKVMGGTNYQSRQDAGVILTPTLEGMLPFAADLSHQALEVGRMLTSDRTKEGVDNAMTAVLPSSLKGFGEIHMTSTMQDKDKNPYTKDRKSLAYKREPGEATVRGIPFHGVGTTREAAMKQQTFLTKNAEAYIDKAGTNVADKFHQAVRNNDKAGIVEYLEKYARLGKDAIKLGDTAETQLEKRFSTEYERMVERASQKGVSDAELMRIQRLIKSMDNVRKNY